MKEYLTAPEIAEENLPDLPASSYRVREYAKREGWDDQPFYFRERLGRGGGREYHYTLMPTLAKLAYTTRHLKVDTAAAAGELAKVAEGCDGQKSAEAKNNRDARLAIVETFKLFARGLPFAQFVCIKMFVDKYNTASLSVDPWIKELLPSISASSLRRWKNSAARKGADALAVDRSKARKGKGTLDQANDGEVKAFVLGLIAHQPHLSAKVVRKVCRDEFGDTIKAPLKGVETEFEMPPVRTFQNFIKTLKAENKVALTKITNPDLYRSTMAPSGTGTLRHIKEPNRLWQIDASPVDALCLDGRHSLYSCVDIATRRQVILISRTPRASAVMLMIRKAIKAWGVPETIKTDNGSDFVANDTKRLFVSLGIEMELSDAYQPQQKGHVERAIRTFQHEVGPQLPGFIGHSVSDRTAIESRKGFAARLGESDHETFGVELSGAALQAHIDDWLENSYQHNPHSGLQGVSPFEAARASSYKPREVGDRALDLLLMKVAGKDGIRTVTKFGVRIDHHHYMTPQILPGEAVLVRMDPQDMGQAYVFEPDGGRYLGQATCPELAGVNPQQYVKEAKALQAELIADATKDIKAQMRQIAKGKMLIERTLEVDKRDAPNVISLPRKTEQHSTPQIDAAAEAMEIHKRLPVETDPAIIAEQRRMMDEILQEQTQELCRDFDAGLEKHEAEIAERRIAHLPKDENVVALPETPLERYRRAYSIQSATDAGEYANPKDVIWLARYRETAEYRGQAAIHEDFGEQYLT